MIAIEVFGSHSLQLVQFYSNVEGTIKENFKSVRNVNYCTPVLTEERKKVNC